jgi:hypothetical protein
MGMTCREAEGTTAQAMVDENTILGQLATAPAARRPRIHLADWPGKESAVISPTLR